MAVPVELPYRNHISERQAGPDEDCLWMAGVEFLREGYDPSIPATHAEGDALRAASGDTGFSNMGNFRIGVAKRYPAIELNASKTGAANIIADFKATGRARVGLVLGKLTNMDSHYRRWYPNFIGGHAVFVAWTPSRGFWWCDPGAPEKRADGSLYLGEPISEAQLAKFIGTYGMPTIMRNAKAVPVVVPPPDVPPPALPTLYTQAQMDEAVAKAKADQKAADEVVCNAKVTVAVATANKAGYNEALDAAIAAVSNLPRK